MRFCWSKPTLFWRFQIAGWLAFIVFSFPLKWVVVQDVRGSLTVSLYRDALGFLLTLSMREIYRRIYPGKVQPLLLALIIVAVSLVGGAILTVLSLLFPTPFDFREDKLFAESAMLGVFYFRTGICLAWSGLYFGFREIQRSAERKRRLILIESEKRGAEVRLLQAQMNPHFLFNALNTIQVEANTLNVQLGSLVRSLADYLRYSLDHTGSDFVPLGVEFDAMRSYLEVEKSRFQENFDFTCSIEESARPASIPGLILQPLVENAVKYGQHTSDGPLQIRVDVSRLNTGMVQIAIRNSGYWIDAGQLPNEKNSHLGIESLRRRLELLYPGQYRLNIEDGNGWVTVSVCLPVT